MCMYSMDPAHFHHCVRVIYSCAYPLPVTEGLFFSGSRVINHGIVTLEQIMNTPSTALQCVTPASDCCTDPGSGDWFGPSGAVIATSTSSDMYQVKGSSFVDLRRNSGGMEGIYRCGIQLSSGAALSSFFVGVYRAGNGRLTYPWNVSCL